MPGQLLGLQRARQGMNEVDHKEVRRPQSAGDKTHDPQPVRRLAQQILRQRLPRRRVAGARVADLGLDESGIRNLGTQNSDS